MSNRIQITGPISQPEQRYTTKQQEILSFRINATHARLNEQTNQWEDQGEPFWVSVSLWERDASRYEGALVSGDRVTVEGVLTIREYQRSDGTTGQGYDLRNVRLLGVIPRKQQSQSQQPYAQPADNPWEQPAAVESAPSYSQADAPF